MIDRHSSIDDALSWATAELGGGADPAAQPRREAELLLAHALGLTHGQLIAQGERALGDPQAGQFTAWVARRAIGEPHAYIVGERDFWTLSLSVTPAVLVPRPETELLVERALHHGQGLKAIDVVDLGTGSGCIALALASERPHWRILAVDCSPAALAVARANAQRLGLARVQFQLSDWCEVLQPGGYQLIVSNPPYIGSAEPALRDAALRHEPQIALSPGADGLNALRTIIAQAPRVLRSAGWLMLEHGSDQALAVRRLLVEQGFAHVTSNRDLAGIERVTEAQWRP